MSRCNVPVIKYGRNLKVYHLKKYSNNSQSIYRILRYLFSAHTAGGVHETGQLHPEIK